MNEKEASSKIKFMLDVGGSDGFTSADKEALNMAINALSAEITAPPKSNADRIRQMTDEELAEFLLESRQICKLCKKHDEICEGAYHECLQGIDDWLKQEVESNDER